MRLAIFGDANNHYKWLSRFFEQTENEVDKYVCLGDMIHHLREGRHIDLTVEMLVEHGVYAVRGNHEKCLLNLERSDVSRDSLEYFANLPDELVLAEVPEAVFVHKSPSRRFTLLMRPSEFEHMGAAYPEQRIAFFGHSHKRLHFEDNGGLNAEYLPLFDVAYDVSSGLHLINPGTVNRAWPPFGFNESPSYAVYDQGQLTFKRIKKS